MEIRVKLSRPIGSDVHHRSAEDEHVLIYYFKRDDTLESVVNQVRIDCEGLSKNFKLLLNGEVLNNNLRKT